MYCNNCGKQIRDDADFCPFCGERIVDYKTVKADNDFNAVKEIHFDNPVPPQPFYSGVEPIVEKKKGKGKIVVIIVAVVLALALAGGAAWFFLFNKGDDNGSDSYQGFVSGGINIKRGNAFYLIDGAGVRKVSDGKSVYVAKDASSYTTDGDILYYARKKDDKEIMCRVKTDGTDDTKLFTFNGGSPLMEKDGVLYYIEKGKTESDNTLYSYDLDSEKKEKKLGKIYYFACFNNRIYFSEKSNLCYYDVEKGEKTVLTDEISGMDIFGNKLYVIKSESGSKNTIYRIDSENKLHKTYNLDYSASEDVSPIDEDNLFIVKGSEARIHNISADKDYKVDGVKDYVTAVDYDGKLMVITKSAAYQLDAENHRLGEKLCTAEFDGQYYLATGDYVYKLEYGDYLENYSINFKVTPIRLNGDIPPEKVTDTEESTAPETQPSKKDISTWKVEGLKNKTYTGKIIKPSFDVVSYDGEYAEFDVTFKNNKKVGTATAEITGKGKYTGTITKTFKILKAKQKLKLKASAKKLKASSLRKKKATLKKVIKTSGNKGKLTFKKSSGSKKVSVSKKGVITVKKGKYKKNTLLKVKVKVTAKGTKSYKKAAKNITVKIKVK